MINLKQANDYTRKLFSTKWVQWIHEGSAPAETSAEKNENVLMGKLSKHCAICLNLNGCCFVKEKCPEIPLHPNCQCKVVEIQSIKANVSCPIEKFTKYVFVFSEVDDKKKVV